MSGLSSDGKGEGGEEGESREVELTFPNRICLIAP